ncbi:MAG: zinc-binding dehydrogenase, partial [Dehalococcoidia bacterium]
AAVVTSLGIVECREVPTPEPSPGKVLVKMDMASICGSDLHFVYHGWPRNDFPLEPGATGHEGIAHVVDGGGAAFKAGDLVLSAPSIWESRNFADYQLISPHYVVALPPGTDPAHLMMAQQLGTVIFAARKLPDLEGKTVAVIGQGSAGLFHDFWLRRQAAARVITIDPIKERLDAGRAFDVDDTIDVTGQRAVDAVLELTGGEGADVVVDAVGGADTLDQAVQMTRRLGAVHVFGLPTTFEKVPFDLSTFFLKHLDVRTIFGAQDEPDHAAFLEAIDLIVGGEIDMTPFVTPQLPLERIDEAFDLARSPRDGALKVSVTMD